MMFKRVFAKVAVAEVPVAARGSDAATSIPRSLSIPIRSAAVSVRQRHTDPERDRVTDVNHQYDMHFVAAQAD
jgi:hypothetical protein